MAGDRWRSPAATTPRTGAIPRSWQCWPTPHAGPRAQPELVRKRGGSVERGALNTLSDFAAAQNAHVFGARAGARADPRNGGAARAHIRITPRWTAMCAASVRLDTPSL